MKRKSNFGFLILGIPMGIFLFYLYFSTPSLNRKNTKSFTGVVSSYKFKDTKSKYGSDEYFILLKYQNAKFEIEDNFLFKKKKKNFEKNIDLGDTIILVIPKEITENQNVIPLYEIKSKGLTFFSFEDYAKRIESGKLFYFWIGLISLIIGFSRLIYPAPKSK
ncbi:MAG: hypothetical protein FGM14_12310 [Flavobacteriales bacterium]|nr:hypothetical protein [Flavobacteriales bacterium]